MGSTFTQMPGKTIKGFAGKEYSVPMYLQFVPGYCSEAVHSSLSNGYAGEQTINSIFAVPHITEKFYKKRSLTNFNEKNRYFPLFRVAEDIPTKGDPVLLCTIGGINYYLGPINTQTNSPTWNFDPNYVDELQITTADSVGGTSRGRRGESFNINKELLYSRLQKFRISELDYGPSSHETTGDYIVEGRHGNSLRIGSRSNNPYLFISNGRYYTNYEETLGDGTLISITSDGTLAQHFPAHAYKETARDPNVSESTDEITDPTFGFKLSSDTLQSPNRYMGDLVSSVNNNQSVDDLIYNYNGNQTLIHSDRITINTKLDDIYLSSIKDIHIGAGRHLTISTNEDLVINSQRIIMGDPSVDSEPMVLGRTLLELLKETLAVVKNSQGICQGAPIPLADETGAPGSVNGKITAIEQQIDKILSTKYFIEPNR